MQLLTFSETNLLDFPESASKAAPLAAEVACIMAFDFGVLGNSKFILYFMYYTYFPSVSPLFFVQTSKMVEDIRVLWYLRTTLSPEITLILRSQKIKSCG